MNRKIGRIGSALTGACVAAFAVCMLAGLRFGSYFVCMPLALGYMMMTAALYAECAPERRATGALGLAMAGVYAVLVLLVYFAQTTTVNLEPLTGDAQRLLDYSRLSLMFNYDLLGYGMMALSTFFAGLAIQPADKGDRALRTLMMIHGVFFLSCFIMPMLGVFSAGDGSTDWTGVLALEVWCAYFLPIAVLAFRHFGAGREGETAK